MQPDALAQSLQDCDEMIKRSLTDENDKDYLYCRSLVTMLKEVPQEEKRWAKIKIMQLIYELQCGIEEETRAFFCYLYSSIFFIEVFHNEESSVLFFKFSSKKNNINNDSNNENNNNNNNNNNNHNHNHIHNNDNNFL